MQRFSAPNKRDNQFHQQRHTKNLYTHDDFFFYFRFAQTTAVAAYKCMQRVTESILTATMNRLGALKIV